ncbi:MAG: fumarylacetoacetate hydrolase family protein [Actinobacteria bacterium]|nr:fumarylacetoacetate hydrolase family protein [Actinomycetota bacterium]
MRLVTYLPPDAPQDGTSFDLDAHGRAAGLLQVFGEEVLVDLERAGRVVGRTLPRRLLDLVAAGPAAWDTARSVLDQATEGDLPSGYGSDEHTLPAELVRLLAPIPTPPMVRDFYAYEDHVRRGFAKRGADIPPEWFELPAFYKQNHRAIRGPEEELPWPAFTDELDYELEIAMVVGVGGRDIPESRAGEHVFGYTIMNDVSARDLQRTEMAVRLGPAKSKDFATVLGPVLVTADELDPLDLHPVARIDGEVVTDSRTSDMRWTFEQMLAYVSIDEDVFPGDVFGSGTVANGCGLEHGRMLRPGEVLELEVPGIGILRNRVGVPRPKVDLPRPRDGLA